LKALLDGFAPYTLNPTPRTPIPTPREAEPRGVEEQLLRRNVKQFRGGLAVKAHRRVYHSTLGWRVIKKKKEQPEKVYRLLAEKWLKPGP